MTDSERSPAGTTPPSSIEDLDTIDTVSDGQALAALALLATRDRVPAIDPHVEEHLREAAANVTTGTDNAAFVGFGVEVGDVPIVAPVSDADLARAALTHLATSNPADVNRALAIICGPHDLGGVGQPAERFEPVTVAVGSLVLLTLQTEVRLDRDSDGHWKLHVHKHHMHDSTLGAVLGRLIGAYAPTPPSQVTGPTDTETPETSSTHTPSSRPDPQHPCP